jgi:GNAT superfamily N-acetyltransferase
LDALIMVRARCPHHRGDFALFLGCETVYRQALSMPEFHYLSIRGAEVSPYLEELGRLRIEVFREFPYLYEGDLDYESEYLKVYERSERSLVVVLQCEGTVVGATTCLPLEDESGEFVTPFLGSEIDPASVFYLGESVILPKYRGCGAGRKFFELREAHARQLGGFRFTAFCAVDRPDDHPMRPEDYRPLHSFWEKNGYVRREDLRCELSWREVGEEFQSKKALTFWLKGLGQ